MDLDKAAEMWRDNASMGQIATALGLNRNQVAGKISRNRDMFPKRGSPVPAKKSSANDIRKMFYEAEVKPEPPPKPKEAAQAYDQSRLPGYTLWELDERGCKFPLLDTVKGETQRFCGETRYQMKPWCKAHHERVWRAQ
jgi:hypothetical protein